jgi:hypothetical protein
MLLIFFFKCLTFLNVFGDTGFEFGAPWRRLISLFGAAADDGAPDAVLVGQVRTFRLHHAWQAGTIFCVLLQRNKRLFREIVRLEQGNLKGTG